MIKNKKKSKVKSFYSQGLGFTEVIAVEVEATAQTGNYDPDASFVFYVARDIKRVDFIDALLMSAYRNKGLPIYNPIDIWIEFQKFIK